MDARIVDAAGGFPIMEEVDMFETATDINPVLKLVVESATRLRATGMGNAAAVQAAVQLFNMSVKELGLDVDPEDNPNG